MVPVILAPSLHPALSSQSLGRSDKLIFMRASELTQEVKGLVTKSDYLSSIPRNPYNRERVGSHKITHCLLFYTPTTHTIHTTYTHHTHIINQYMVTGFCFYFCFLRQGWVFFGGRGVALAVLDQAGFKLTEIYPPLSPECWH